MSDLKCSMTAFEVWRLFKVNGSAGKPPLASHFLRIHQLCQGQHWRPVRVSPRSHQRTEDLTASKADVWWVAQKVPCFTVDLWRCPNREKWLHVCSIWTGKFGFSVGEHEGSHHKQAWLWSSYLVSSQTDVIYIVTRKYGSFGRPFVLHKMDLLR